MNAQRDDTRTDAILRIIERLAPARGSGLASVEITAGGRTVTLTAATRAKVRALRKRLKLREETP